MVAKIEGDYELVTEKVDRKKEVLIKKLWTKEILLGYSGSLAYVLFSKCY